MNIQKLIEHFNQPDTHLVLSGWPETHGAKSYHGDGVFTRETLKVLSKNHGMRFVVLSDLNTDNEPQLLENDSILLLRVFDHSRIHLYPTVLTWLKTFSKIRHITIHSNFAYAGIGHFVLLVPFLLLIKLTGRKITYVAHNVIESIGFIAKQLNITSPVVIKLLNICVKLYNQLIGLITDRVVVLDASGYELMQQYVSHNKLYLNPHWAKPHTTQWTKSAAKNALGIPPDHKVILSFGFISWYKGSDILARVFSKSNYKKVHLIFAGGQAPSQMDKAHYREFYKTFQKNVQGDHRIIHTGFVPEKEIGKYFAAADLVVLPYRGLMGGSGALGFALGYKKPFLISTHMNGMWQNPDMRLALKQTGLLVENATFTLDTKGVDHITRTVNNARSLKQLQRFSQTLLGSRDIETITRQLYNDIYAPISKYETAPTAQSQALVR